MPRHASAAARPDEIRQHNLSLLLTHVHRDGPLTRAQLTQRLGLSRSTVGALVGELTDLGLLEEVVPVGGAGVGRPSHLVAPRHDGPFVVGVDIDVAHVTVASVGLGGGVQARELLELGTNPRPEDLVGGVGQAIGRLVAKAAPAARPCGIGVSVPGTVDRRTGRVGVAPNLGWQAVELGDLLRSAVPVGVGVAVGNDADLSLLAEHLRGSARGSDDVVYLLGRIGVGAGIISGGVPLRGRDGHAGEIGHNVLDPSGPPCHCGQRGCIETYVGDAALLAMARRPGPPDDTAMAALFADARAGERVALDAVRAAAEPLGRTIASLLNTLNPERVVLGGSVADLLELARPEVQAAMDRYTFADANREVELVAPALGKDAALLGAAEIAFAGLLADPQ